MVADARGWRVSGHKGDITAEQARQILEQRRRMRESLVGFAENIVIPGVALDGDDDETLVGDPYQVTGKDGQQRWAEPAPRKEWAKLNVFEPVGSKVSALHRLLMEKIQATMTTPYGRLMVFAPPGSAKSTYCSVVGPAWYMGRFAGRRLILASYATELAKKHGAKARNICDQDVYQGAFGCSLSDDTTKKEMWSLNNSSEYMAGGLLSGLTGNRADGLIIDDPIKGRQAADSAKIRESTQNSYQHDALTRLAPKGFIIMVLTRWTEGDPAGNILPEDYNGESGKILCRDGMVWDVLNIPAECERADDPLGRPIGDGMGGVPGSMLWEEWFDAKHWVQHRRDLRGWAALFQQRPKSDTSVQFRKEWFERFTVDEMPRALNRYTASDYATGEDEGDWTVHLGAGMDKTGKLWIFDRFRGQVQTDKGVRGLITLAKASKTRRGFGEMGQIRKAIEPWFQQAKKKAGVRLEIVYLPHIGDKVAKVQSFRAMAAAGEVAILEGEWGDELIKELCDFPKPGVPDDQVDACGLFGRGLEGIVWAREREADVKEAVIKPFTWAWLTYKDPSEGKKGGRMI